MKVIKEIVIAFLILAFYVWALDKTMGIAELEPSPIVPTAMDWTDKVKPVERMKQ